MKIRRRILCSLIVLHIFVKTDCGTLCGNRCCLNFYQSPDGDCLECPVGFHGINCTYECHEGWYGRLCQSECDCPAERCNSIYGCQKRKNEGTESKSTWVNVTYALIGSVTTMSLIGLMFYLRSWFSKIKASSSSVTNQVYTDQAENQEEHRYESRRSSSSTETEPVLQRTPNHQDLNSYTDLRFSQMQPMYDNSKDEEFVQEPRAPSVDSLPSPKKINGNKNEVNDNNDADHDEAYERYFEHEGYNVLSLRKPSMEKSMTLRSLDASIKLQENAEGMHDEYDSMEMKEKQKEECASELGIKQCELTKKVLSQKSSIDETIKDYIESAQLNRKLGMIKDNETSALISISKSKSFTARESDRPKRFSSRPYSLANSSWRKRHIAGLSKLSRISDDEEVFSLEDEECDGDKAKCSDSNIQSNNESSDDQSMPTVSIEKEHKKQRISPEDKAEFEKPYEEIDLLENESHINTKEKDGSFESDPSDAYSQVQKRSQLQFNDSSTLSVELLNEEGKLNTKM